ncbi:MAG TPA: RHS repeat-associated core domain-containing protein [Thermoanaerobaculia bacterium]|nr:RHS repeat-associated core domain-containing protein [Thermoanaerobaculia bacterium]
MGRLVRAVDANGFATTLDYDTLGRKLSQTDANGNRWTYTYDRLGRLLEQHDPEGHVTRLQYDSASRILEKIYSQGAQTWAVRYSYDASQSNGRGRLASVTDDGGLTVSFSYDAEGRVAREDRLTADSYSTSYQYDAAGRLIESSFPDGTAVRYRFDGEHLAAVDSTGGSSLVAADMDAWGRPQLIRFGNGTTSSRSFCPDADFRLCALEIRSPTGELLFGETYRFDRAGNIVAIFDSGNGYRWFAYDELGRLTSAWRNFEIEDFDYDPAGNIARTSRRGPYRYSLSPAPTHPHALRQAAADSFTYDRAGSEVSGPGRSFIYDTAGRPIEVAVGKKRTQVHYAGTGERKERVVAARPLWPPTAFFRTLIGRDTILERTYYAAPEYRCDSDGCARFVSAEETPLAIEDAASGTPGYLHFDALGSLRLVTGPSGNVLQSSSFSAFGVPLQRRANLDQLRLLPTVFASMELDEATELYAGGSRYYDPSLARFLAVDPAGAMLASPSALNPYVYALNNPLAFADPDGEHPILIAIGVGALLGGLQAGAASDWDFDQIMRGIVIGGISGAVGYGVGSFAGPIIGGGAAGSTGAFLGGGDPAKGFAFGMIGAGLAQGGTELLSSEYLGGAAGGAATAALAGENPGEAALFSFAGTAVGDWINDASGPGESLKAEVAEPAAEVAATAEPQSAPEAGFDFAKESLRVREAQRMAEVIAYDVPVQPSWSPLDFLGAGNFLFGRWRTGLIGWQGVLNRSKYFRVGLGPTKGYETFRIAIGQKGMRVHKHLDSPIRWKPPFRKP